MTHSLRTIAFLTAMTAVVTGCSTVDIARRKPIPFASDGQPAVRCVCLWQEAEGQLETGETTRGFAGQVYFFTAESEAPVAVEGDVQVFLFDDHGSPEEQARPISQAGFANVEWQAMRHESKLGPAYSLFVPYPRAGNYEANCALRVRLTHPDGTAMFSKMTPVKLLGLPRPERQEQVHAVDSRREQQWVADQRPATEERTTGETIGIRRGHRLILNQQAEAPSRGHEISRDSLSERQPAPDTNSRVKYYEDKLQTILKQRAAKQSAEGHRGHDVIQQTGYQQSSGSGQSRHSDNPFYSF